MTATESTAKRLRNELLMELALQDERVRKLTRKRTPVARRVLLDDPDPELYSARRVLRANAEMAKAIGQRCRDATLLEMTKSILAQLDTSEATDEAAEIAHLEAEAAAKNPNFWRHNDRLQKICSVYAATAAIDSSMFLGMIDRQALRMTQLDADELRKYVMRSSRRDWLHFRMFELLRTRFPADKSRLPTPAEVEAAGAAALPGLHQHMKRTLLKNMRRAIAKALAKPDAAVAEAAGRPEHKQHHQHDAER